MAIKTKTALKAQNTAVLVENVNEEITATVMHNHLEDIIDSMRDVSAFNLGDLSDVSVSAPTNGQILTYSGGTWSAGAGSTPYWSLIGSTLTPTGTYSLRMGLNNVNTDSGKYNITAGNSCDNKALHGTILSSFHSTLNTYASYSAVIAGSGITETESFTLHTTYLKLLGGVKADGITGNTWTGSGTDNYLITKGYADSMYGGGGSPGGSTKSIQFNDGGTFGGENNFEYDKSTHSITVNRYTGAAFTLGINSLLINHGGSSIEGTTCFVMGASCSTDNSEFSFIMGTTNTILNSGTYPPSFTTLLGSSNSITNTSNLDCDYNFLQGSTNSITSNSDNTSGNILLGVMNSVSGSLLGCGVTSYNHILGTGNVIESSSQNKIFGTMNQVYSSSVSSPGFALGDSNILNHVTSQSVVIGSMNYIYYAQGISIGTLNEIRTGATGYIFGEGNRINTGLTDVVIIGTGLQNGRESRTLYTNNLNVVGNGIGNQKITLGDANVDGSWRFTTTSAGVLKLEKRVASVWVVEDTWS